MVLFCKESSLISSPHAWSGIEKRWHSQQKCQHGPGSVPLHVHMSYACDDAI